MGGERRAPRAGERPKGADQPPGTPTPRHRVIHRRCTDDLGPPSLTRGGVVSLRFTTFSPLRSERFAGKNSCLIARYACERPPA